MLIEYSSNNSGGDWWLSDNDWIALEKAGWYVIWGGLYFCSETGILAPPAGKEKCELDECPGHRKYESAEEVAEVAERYLGALATKATKEFENVKGAIEEFENVTGQDASDEGCNCCGPPHSFEWTDSDGEWNYCSGEDCLKYLYSNIPSNLREAVELLNEGD